MPRINKADLENKIVELERQLENYQQWLIDSEIKCNELIHNAEMHLDELPAYKQAMERNEQLELINEESLKSIDRLEQRNTALKNRVRELKIENQQLKESIKNKTVISETTHNARGAGRKPKDAVLTQQQLLQLDRLLQQGLKEKDICSEMQISRATYYRLKKLI